MKDTLNDKTINPYRAYSLAETAELIGVHPVTLRKKLNDDIRENDPFMQKANPQKIGREWRFMGDSLLRALGSVTYTGESNEHDK